MTNSMTAGCGENMVPPYLALKWRVHERVPESEQAKSRRKGDKKVTGSVVWPKTQYYFLC